jgi:threonine/homoserine/homoserine lactone efflux protein
MPTLTHHLQFALVALAMVLTPGPNMIYLISRSVCQGRIAGLISLGGIALGFMGYLVCAALGLTAIFLARG